MGQVKPEAGHGQADSQRNPQDDPANDLRKRQKFAVESRIHLLKRIAPWQTDRHDRTRSSGAHDARQQAARDHLWMHFTRHSVLRPRPRSPRSCAATAPTSTTRTASATSTASPASSSSRPATGAPSSPRPPRSRPPSWRSSRCGPTPTPARWTSPRGSRTTPPATSTGSSSPPAAARRSRPRGSSPSSYFKLTGKPTKHKVISRAIAYHGTPQGALSITGLPGMKAPFEPLVPEHVPGAEHELLPRPRAVPRRPTARRFGRWAADRIAEAIEFEGPETVAAVFLEPVQNSGGCFPPPPGYFERVREICDEYDVLLVSDEVICAFGRLGAHVRRRALRLPAGHHHLRQGAHLGLLPARRDDRHRPALRAVPHGHRDRSRTATPSAATRCPRRWRWPTSTSSSGRAQRARPRHRGRLPRDPGEAARPAARRRRPRRRLLLRHRAGQGQGHQGDLRRRRVRAAAARLPVQGARSTPACTAAPTTAATRSSSSPRR